MTAALRRRSLLAALPALALAATASRPRAAAEGADILALGHLDPAGVTLVDRSRGELRDHLSLGHEPAQLLIDGRERRLLASDYDNGLTLLPLADGAAPRYLPLPFMPVHMQAAPGRDLLAINGLTEEGLWLLDPALPGEARRIRGLVEPHNYRFDRTARRLYVADRGGRGLAVVDPARAERVAELGLEATARMPAEAVPDGVALATHGRSALLLHDGADRAATVSLADGRSLVGPALGGQPDRPRSDPRGRFFLVELAETGEVLLLAPDMPTVLARLPLGATPALAAWLWFDQILALAAPGSDRLLLVDLESMRMLAERPLPGPVTELAATAAGDRLLLFLDDPPRILAVSMPDLELRERAPLPAPATLAATAGGASFCS